MLTGLPPFYSRDQNHHVIFKMIKEKEVGFTSKHAFTSEAKVIISQVNLSEF